VTPRPSAIATAIVIAIAIANIAWRDIEALLVGLGAEVTEREGSRVAIVLFQEVRVLHRPHPTLQTDRGAVVSVKKWLEQHGVKP
jgi:hypothetical protein